MSDEYDHRASCENFQSEQWDHRAIRGAVEAMSPATSEAVAAAWDEIGRRFQDSITAFHDATRSALASGWRGPAAGAAASAIDSYVVGAHPASEGFRDVGAALREAIAGAEAVRAAVGEPVGYATDWTRVMPWNWSGEAESVAAEDAAKAAMGSVYSSANQTAGGQLPTLDARTPDAGEITSTHAAATGQPVGFDYGPNGIHGIPSDPQVAEDTRPEDSPNEHRRGESPHDDFTDAPRQPDVPAGTGSGSGSVAGAALAGAVGGGVAQYANRVVAAHQASAAAPAQKPAAKSQSTGTGEQAPAEEHTYLENIDSGSPVIGPLPHVSPAVIGR